jgi:hypothetical protein
MPRLRRWEGRDYRLLLVVATGNQFDSCMHFLSVNMMTFPLIMFGPQAQRAETFVEQMGTVTSSPSGAARFFIREQNVPALRTLSLFLSHRFLQTCRAYGAGKVRIIDS